MITALDHIAIAVPDLEKAIKRFMEDFGLTFEGTEDVKVRKRLPRFSHCPPPASSWFIRLTAKGQLPNISRKSRAAFTTCVFAPMTLKPMSRA